MTGGGGGEENLFKEINLPQQQKLEDGGLPFPAIVSPNDAVPLPAFLDSIRAHKPWLESLLFNSGAILFRGFPVVNPSDFNDVVEAFGFPEMSYVGGFATRTHVVGRVYTANEAPPHHKIGFHHEMAYLPDSPSKLFFFCEVEPGCGGETPLVLSHIVYEKMKERHPEFVARLEEHGSIYTNIMGDEDDPSNITGRGWKSAFMTDDKNTAEERAAKLGMKLEWMEGAVKTTLGPMPAIKLDKARQRKIWFNSIAASYNRSEEVKRIRFGNGERFPSHVIDDCSKIHDEECVAIPWQKGDILLVDNLAVLHARQPLIKPPRRVLASLCK